jgi:hypothetical protein
MKGAMFAFGPKQTSLFALSMSAFEAGNPMRHKRISNELRNSIAPNIANAKRKSKGG